MVYYFNILWFTVSRSLSDLMSIASELPSNQLTLCPLACDLEISSRDLFPSLCFLSDYVSAQIDHLVFIFLNCWVWRVYFFFLRVYFFFKILDTSVLLNMQFTNMKYFNPVCSLQCTSPVDAVAECHRLGAETPRRCFSWVQGPEVWGQSVRSGPEGGAPAAPHSSLSLATSSFLSQHLRPSLPFP